MIKIPFWAGIFSFVTLCSVAQNNLYVRFDVGPAGDIYNYTDDGLELGTRPVINGLWGFALGDELNNSMGLETGLYRNYFQNSFYFKKVKLSSGSTALFDTWQFPFRLKTRFNLYRNIFTLGTITGVNFCLNPGYRNSGNGSNRLENNQSGDSVNYYYSYTGSENKNFVLLETGLTFTIRLFKGFHLNLSGSYCNGFKKLYETDVIYRVNNKSLQHGIIFTNGDYFNLSFGLKYMFPKFHRKNKNR